MRKATAGGSTHAMLRKWGLVAAALLVAGFAATAGAQPTGKTYRSPLHNFTVPVPPGIGMQVQDGSGDNGGSVSFYDDLGSLKGILYLRLSPDTQQMQRDTAKRRLILESFLNDYALDLFRHFSPAAGILHAEHIAGPDHEAYFAIVDIPEGSTMFDARDKRRYDTRRGLLIFIRGEFIYMLSSGEHPSALELGKPAQPLARLIEAEKTQLSRFRSSIDFK